MTNSEQYMEANHLPSRWGFWLQWVLTGIITSWLIQLLDAPSTNFTAQASQVVYFLVIMSILWSIMQWLILRRYLPRAGWWIPASAVGIFAGWVLGGMFVGVANALLGLNIWDSQEHPFLLVYTGIQGACIGFFQWLVLRKKVRRAGLWILACSIAWALAQATFILGLNLSVGGILLTDLTVVVGAITGVVLVWLLRQPALIQDR